MKLVSNVEKLDIYNFQDIAGCARRFADQVEAEGKNLVRVLVVCEYEDGIALCMWGENASGYETLGILEAAKLRAHEANIMGED